MEQPSSCLSVQIQNRKRRSVRTRTVHLQRHTSLSSRWLLPRRLHQTRQASPSISFSVQGVPILFMSVDQVSFRLRSTPAMLNSNYIAFTHNIHALHAHQHALRTQQYPPNSGCADWAGIILGIILSIITYIGHRAQCGHNMSVQAKHEHNNLL